MDGLRLEPVFRISCWLAATVEIGKMNDGVHRFVAINGGVVEGRELRGCVLPGGADWQVLRHDGITELAAHYVLEAEDGVKIQVKNRGLRHGSPEVLARIAAGEPVDSTEYYCRTSPIFVAPEGPYSWLNRYTFAAKAERLRDAIHLDIFKVL